MSVHSQRTSKDLVTAKTNNKSVKRSDYLRIKFLFEKWRNWLLYFTLGYVISFVAWLSFFVKITNFLLIASDRFDQICSNSSPRLRVFVNSYWLFPIVLFIIIMRGLVFCIDGFVSASLKSPFGQITYSINKLGIRNSESDEIVTILTEINEHFKETFKKFGVFKIAVDLFHICNSLMSAKESKDQHKEMIPNIAFLENRRFPQYTEFFTTLSLFIPIIIALWRIEVAKKLIEKLEVGDD